MMIYRTETFLYPIWLKQTLGHLNLWIVSNFFLKKRFYFFDSAMRSCVPITRSCWISRKKSEKFWITKTFLKISSFKVKTLKRTLYYSIQQSSTLLRLVRGWPWWIFNGSLLMSHAVFYLGHNKDSIMPPYWPIHYWIR